MNKLVRKINYKNLYKPKKEMLMKINRMAEEHTFPTWALKNDKADEIEKTRTILANGLDRLNCTPSNEVNDDILTAECCRIDDCAKNCETYCYNLDWKEEDIQHLLEYAKVAGAEKVLGLSAEVVKEILDSDQEIYDLVKSELPVEASNKAMTKTASNSNENKDEIDPSDFRFDPFRLEQIMNEQEAKPDVWETVSKQQVLNNKPLMESSVRPIRGGEDTSVSNNPSLAANQNSIENPDAIQQMAESEQDDTGARLAAEKAAREQAKKDEHTQWEQDKIDAMSKSNIVPKGTVFPTESLNAQPGIRDSIVAAHSKFDPNDLPDHTEGEQLKAQNEARKQSIQRETSDDKEWDSIKPQSSFGVSDAFAESLKQHLGK